MKRVHFHPSIVSPVPHKIKPKFKILPPNNRLHINNKLWKPYPYKLFFPEPYLKTKFYKLDDLKLYNWAVELYTKENEIVEFDDSIIPYFPTFADDEIQNLPLFGFIDKKNTYSLLIQYILTVRGVNEMNPNLLISGILNYKKLAHQIEIPFYVGDNGIVIVKTNVLLQIYPNPYLPKTTMLSTISSTILGSFNFNLEETAGNGININTGMEFFIDLCASKNWFENADSAQGEPYPGLFHIYRFIEWQKIGFEISAPCEIDPLELIYSALTKYIPENVLPEIEFLNVETIDHRKLKFNSKLSEAPAYHWKIPKNNYTYEKEKKEINKYKPFPTDFFYTL